MMNEMHKWREKDNEQTPLIKMLSPLGGKKKQKISALDIGGKKEWIRFDPVTNGKDWNWIRKSFYFLELEMFSKE